MLRLVAMSINCICHRLQCRTVVCCSCITDTNSVRGDCVLNGTLPSASLAYARLFDYLIIIWYRHRGGFVLKPRGDEAIRMLGTCRYWLCEICFIEPYWLLRGLLPNYVSYLQWHRRPMHIITTLLYFIKSRHDCYHDILLQQYHYFICSFIIICWPLWLSQLFTLLQYYLQSQSHLLFCFIASATLAFCCCF